MKNFLLGMLFSVLLFKVSEITYTYYWWEYEKPCRIESTFKKEMVCIKNKLGIIHYLGYLNLNYVRFFDTWRWIK